VPNGGARKVGYTPEARCVMNRGDLLIGTKAQEGISRGEWYNSSSDETSKGMYKVKEAIEKSCSDLLAAHPRKCVCALAGMAT
jgi:hypothetical protein